MDFVIIGLAVVILVLVFLRKPADVSGIEADLSELRDSIHLKHSSDTLIAETVQRVERALLGARTRGLAGEQLLEGALAAVPPDWIIRDFRISNKPVEFALKLPNGKVVPIDSKWPAQRQLEQLATTDDPQDQKVLKEQINRIVLDKVREVRKYIDPSLTMPFGIAAVPDAVFAVSTKAVHRAIQSDVVVLSYSMVLPYMLLLRHTTTVDRSPENLQRVMGHLTGIASVLVQLQEEVEGRFSKGLTMLTNTRDESRVLLAKALTSITAIDEDPDG